MPFADRYGPWAVITGASSGLGEEFAHAVAARGVRPLLVARREDELARVAADVQRASGVTCERLALDLAEPAFLDQLSEATAGKNIGLVIGNAGFNPPGAFGAHERATHERVLDVNARANLLLAQAFLPRLVGRGRGGLLFVASVESYFGVPYSVGYAASKAYVLSLAEGLWGEAKRAGVDVQALVPGPLDTPLFQSRQVRVPAMAPRRAADRALDHLGRGPSYVPAASDRWAFRILRALPRRVAVRAIGFGMRRTIDRPRRKGGLA
jgi:short-subunit dehydrogenase